MKTIHYKTYDHPEACGRKPLPHEQAYTLSFETENGEKVQLHMGQTGFNEVTNLLMDMLSNAPSHDDGSTGRSIMEELTSLRTLVSSQKGQIERAESRIAKLEDTNAKYAARICELQQIADRRLQEVIDCKNHEAKEREVKEQLRKELKAMKNQNKSNL